MIGNCNCRPAIGLIVADRRTGGWGRRRESETGSALINALIFIAALAILGMALSKLTAYRVQEMQRKQNNLQAQWAAESGIEEALLQLQQDPAWYADDSDTRPLLKRDWERWQYQVGAHPLPGGNDYRVEAVGAAGHSTRTEARTVVMTSPLRYALYATEKLTIGPQVRISGPIYAGEKIEGDIPEGAQVDTYPREFHTAALPILKTFLDLHPTRMLEGFLRDYRVENRFLLKQGALTLQTGTLTRTSIIAAGILTVEGKTIATAAPNRPLLIADDAIFINLAEGSRLEGVIYCPDKIAITGAGLISGTVIAKEIQVSGSVQLRLPDPAQLNSRGDGTTIPGFPPRLSQLER